MKTRDKVEYKGLSKQANKNRDLGYGDAQNKAAVMH